MDYSQILRGFLALLFVLALIGGVTVIARYFRLTPRASKIIKSSKKRLSIVEVLPVDAKRRLVLINQDKLEHLILIGPDKDLLIDSGKQINSNNYEINN